MIGAIIGDIVGSVYEFNNIKKKDFELFNQYSTFTDDTITTVALADCLLNNGDPVWYLQQYCRKYDDPAGGYGMSFADWINSEDPKPYNSWGNGAAMRISSVAFALNDWEEIGWKTVKYTEITHNNKFGIEGALATSQAIFLGKSAKDKEYLREIINEYYPNFNKIETLDEIRKFYRFNESCLGTVPYAIKCVLDSVNFEDAIRNAISLGGDSDTLACIAGGIAEAYYKEIPNWIVEEARKRLPDDFLEVIDKIHLKATPPN